MRTSIDARTRRDLMSTVLYAVRKSPHFRPRKGEERNVWGSLTDEAGRSTAESIVEHMLLSGWAIRRQDEAPLRTEPPAGWAVCWVRRYGVEMGPICPDDGIPIAVGPRQLLGQAVLNTGRKGMSGTILPQDGDNWMRVEVYSVLLLAELARLARLAAEAEIKGSALERRG